MKTLFLALASFIIFIAPARADTEQAIFAMGCFWCAEHDFKKVDGVTDVVSGYTGGTKETATYDQVSSGKTDHVEAVAVTYDPAKISYQKLLRVFWDNVDPFDAEGQFCDKGKQYSAILFVRNESEKKLAEESLLALQTRHPHQEVVVKIEDAKPFYEAEAYHQDYAETNKARYEQYRKGCGRDARLKKVKSN